MKIPLAQMFLKRELLFHKLMHTLFRATVTRYEPEKSTASGKDHPFFIKKRMKRIHRSTKKPSANASCLTGHSTVEWSGAWHGYWLQWQGQTGRVASASMNRAFTRPPGLSIAKPYRPGPNAGRCSANGLASWSGFWRTAWTGKGRSTPDWMHKNTDLPIKQSHPDNHNKNDMAGKKRLTLCKPSNHPRRYP